MMEPIEWIGLVIPVTTPVVGLLVGVVLLYADPDNPKRQWAVRFSIILLVAACIVQVATNVLTKIDEVSVKDELVAINSKLDKTIAQRDGANGESEKYKLLLQQATLQNISDETTSSAFEEAKAIVEEDKQRIALEQETSSEKMTRVIYYQKKADGTRVTDALKSVSFNYDLHKLKSNPYYDRRKLGTNALLCGTATSIDEVKGLAVALLENGVRLQYLGGFFQGERSTNGNVMDLRSIGDENYFIHKTVLTKADVKRLSNCDIDDDS